MNMQNHVAAIIDDCRTGKSMYLQATVAAMVASAVSIRRSIVQVFERWKMVGKRAGKAP